MVNISSTDSQGIKTISSFSGNPIITTRVVDTDGSVCKGTFGAEYRTSVNTPYFHGGEDVSFTEFQDTMKVWYDETYGVMANVPGYGEVSLYEPASFEKAREIKYVVLMGGRYDGESPIVYARIMNMLLEFQTSESFTTTTTTTSSTTTETSTTGTSTITSTTTTSLTSTDITGLDPSLKFSIIGVSATVIFGIIGLIFRAELLDTRRKKILGVAIGIISFAVISLIIWEFL
jgi:hypothetical protein